MKFRSECECPCHQGGAVFCGCFGPCCIADELLEAHGIELRRDEERQARVVEFNTKLGEIMQQARTPGLAVWFVGDSFTTTAQHPTAEGWQLLLEGMDLALTEYAFDAWMERLERKGIKNGKD